MIKRHLPHTAIGTDNPLFNLEIKRVRFAETPDRLARYTRWVLVVGTVVFALAMFLILQSTRNYAPYVSDENVLFWFVVIGILADGMLDIACMVSGLSVISSEIASGRWNLLRLSGLRFNDIVAAKYALTQVRAWRAMVLIIAFRLAVAFILTRELVVTSGISIISNLLGWYALACLAGLVAVYLIEPFWRTCSVTALSLVISAYGSSVSFAFLAAFFAIVLLWIVQVVIIAVFIWMLIATGGSLSWLVLFPALIIAFLGVVLTFYRWLREWALGRTRLRLHNLD